MEKITFINANGAEIEFNASFPYKLKKKSGFAECDVVPHLSPAYGINGQIYRGSTLGVRYPKFDFWISSDTIPNFYTAQKTIIDLFNPLLGEGVLIYENDIGKYRIDAAVADGPVPLELTDRSGHYEVVFICAQPLWESYIEHSITFTSSTSLVARTITNAGNSPTPIRVEFTVASGTATGCRVEKDRAIIPIREYIKVIGTLNSTSQNKLIVDTDEIQPTVTFENILLPPVSGFNKIDPETTFFLLPAGDRLIETLTDSGTVTVNLYWRDRYSGV